MEKFQASETEGKYIVITQEIDKNDILSMAISIAKNDLATGKPIKKPEDAVESLRSLLMSETREIFAVLFLDSQHRVIKLEEMFKGTINLASVYPREIVKRVLELNSAKIILCHNHPSGITVPSPSDIKITSRIKSCLNLFDVEILDHFIVSPESYTSFQEMNLL